MSFIILTACLLSIFRLPYAVVPYLTKFFLFVAFGEAFSRFWNHHFIQIVRVVCEILNLFVTFWLFHVFFQDRVLLNMFLNLAFFAECIRLLCEKGVMGWSAFWQALPHRAIANLLANRYRSGILRRYIRYYILSDEKRIVRSLSMIKANARLFRKPQTSEKLGYVNAFQIVPDEFPLRSGIVRNVARGEVYIHAKWLNNLDLLWGLALRRSPWIFDPRHLRRPFYYRSEANPLMTRFVLENASLCPLFSIYEFGHEIKAARYELFYKLMRRIGVNLEQPVNEDGTNNFDVLAKTLVKFRSNPAGNRPLWTDHEVLKEIWANRDLSPLSIAEKYTYPLVYVQEILLPQIASMIF
jgi:hypothetical protein